MRTRRGFARHFVLLGTVFATGLLAGGAAVSVHAVRGPARVANHGGELGQSPEGADVSLAAASATDQVAYRGVDYRGMRLTGDLSDRSFIQCDFRGADLRGAELTGCEFWSCDLRGARLDGAELTGISYSAETRWPAGFNPQALDARRDE